MSRVVLFPMARATQCDHRRSLVSECRPCVWLDRRTTNAGYVRVIGELSLALSALGLLALWWLS